MSTESRVDVLTTFSDNHEASKWFRNSNRFVRMFQKWYLIHITWISMVINISELKKPWSALLLQIEYCIETIKWVGFYKITFEWVSKYLKVQANLRLVGRMLGKCPIIERKFNYTFELPVDGHNPFGRFWQEKLWSRPLKNSFGVPTYTNRYFEGEVLELLILCITSVYILLAITMDHSYSTDVLQSSPFTIDSGKSVNKFPNTTRDIAH